MSNLKKYHFISVLVFLLAVSPQAYSQTASTAPEISGKPGGWHHVTVGVKDLEVALQQWIGQMGFEIRSQREGPDAGLAALWQIKPDDIERQAIVGTPGADLGMVHLVQFHNPDPPVREGADVFDLVPKNLDVFVENMPVQFKDLTAAGASFRTDTYSDVTTPSGTRFMEIHMHGHDKTNLVLVDTPNSKRPHYTAKGFSGVVQLITIAPDAEQEEVFYVQALGLDAHSKNYLKGPEIEKMVGLPPGAALDIRILGGGNAKFGLMEVVDYHGVEGVNRYPLAKPKALGTLHVSYFLDDLAPLQQRLTAFGTVFEKHESTDTLFGSGPSISFQTPAGLRIEAHLR